MAEPNKDSQEKVSLEELLRLKRAERPDEGFWNRFDGELHQRMMQALVKKDPWPVQLMRALSGKLAQTAAIGAVAAVLAILVIRPAFLATSGASPLQLADAEAAPQAAAGRSISEIDPALLAELAEADYAIEVYTADAVDGAAGVTREFGLDRMEVATYEHAVYSPDSALPGFASTGVASLVY
ncbi:MAG: hypothetical protein ACPG3X_02320 [Opitutales bacterium]